MKTVDLDKTNWKEMLTNAGNEIKIVGTLTLDAIKAIRLHLRGKFDTVVDLTEVVNYIDYESWSTFLGYSHSGPVYGASGFKKVETLPRLLSEISADEVRLPAYAMRRHVNRLVENEYVCTVVVHPDSKLFSMKGGDVWNKKGTKLIRKNGKE